MPARVLRTACGRPSLCTCTTPSSVPCLTQPVPFILPSLARQSPEPCRTSVASPSQSSAALLSHGAGCPLAIRSNFQPFSLVAARCHHPAQPCTASLAPLSNRLLASHSLLNAPDSPFNSTHNTCGGRARPPPWVMPAALCTSLPPPCCRAVALPILARSKRSPTTRCRCSTHAPHTIPAFLVAARALCMPSTRPNVPPPMPFSAC